MFLKEEIESFIKLTERDEWQTFLRILDRLDECTRDPDVLLNCNPTHLEFLRGWHAAIVRIRRLKDLALEMQMEDADQDDDDLHDLYDFGSFV